MGGYQAYSEYKDSDIVWLGKIPAHWGAVKLKRATRFAYGDSLSAEKRIDGDVDVFGSNGIVGTHDESNTGAPVIIVGRKGSFGKLIYSEKPGYAIDTTFFIDRTQTQQNLRWLYYTMSCLELDAQSKDSAVPGLSREDAYDKVAPLPPLPEQHTIAHFLDHKTAQIDALIAKKEALLARLAAKRTALISHAVTKGLDPTVPMKDSGVAWLGKIPNHWGVTKVGYISRVVRGQTPRPAGDPAFFFGDVLPWITVGEITKDDNKLVTSTETMLTEAGVRRSIVFSEGTLVLTNSGATLGVPKILGLTGCMNDGVAALLDLRSDMAKDFVYYFLHSMTQHLRSYMQTSGQPNLNTTVISGLSLPLPPYSEQVQICEFIEREIESLRRIEGKIAAAIDKLKQYRTALITNAVTGKIDVRNVPLPQRT